MPKRKRDDDERNIDRIRDQAVRIRASRLKARFDQGVLQLTQALKLARGFDRQKMTRRISQAGTDKSKLERLNAEIEILKGLQEPKVARRYLLKQCVRTKRIAEADGFIALFGGTEKVEGILKKGGAIGPVEGNVLGRLMKSGAVSEVLPGIMKGVREVSGADKEKVMNGVAAVERTNGTKRAKIEASTGVEEVEEEFGGFSDGDHAGEGGVPVEADNMAEGSEDDLLEAYDDRLAASSDAESDLSDKYEKKGQNHDRLDDMEITSEEDVSGQEDLSGSLTSDFETNNNAENLSSTKTIAGEPVKVTSTSFLPTLMHGGYYSGSEDASDDDNAQDYNPDKSFASVAQPRKNRRGQRARQLIAEKKHGNKAKHLLKANGAENVHSARQAFINGGVRRDQGWDARRGAVGESGRRGERDTDRKSNTDRNVARPLNRFERRNGITKQRARGGISDRGRGSGGAANASRSTGANSMAVTGDRRPKIQKDTSKVGNAKLHPSWEAARKRKIESATVGASSFAGKKITFD